MESIRFVSTLLDEAEVAVHLNVALVTVSLARTDQFGLGIMESMACGAVPIVSKLAVYGQYLQDGVNAFFAERADPADVAEKIIHCIQHPELQLRFHELNRAIIFDKENRDKNAPETVDLYRRLAPGRT
jgi:glycosyltransferase involved in cell wall biosynthesis